MKKYIILKPNCRELANHLWNYLSIYAYGLETGAQVQNPSFSQWHRYFTLSKKESILTKLFSFFSWLSPVWNTVGTLYGSYLVRSRAACVQVTFGIFTFLPPTRPLATPKETCGVTYFIGWFFRNPVGLERYRNQLVTAFTPGESVQREIDRALNPLQGKHLIGVHVRGLPFKGFEHEHFLVPAPRVRQIIDEYLRERKIKPAEAALVVVSDTPIDQTAFAGLTTLARYGNDVTNLFLLSRCAVVIGTNSTFSALAAWFANVSHIVATNDPVDWTYYARTTSYFENKYATFAN